MMLSVIMLSAAFYLLLRNVVGLSVVMLSVVAPEEHLGLVSCTDNANQSPVLSTHYNHHMTIIMSDASLYIL